MTTSETKTQVIKMFKPRKAALEAELKNLKDCYDNGGIDALSERAAKFAKKYYHSCYILYKSEQEMAEKTLDGFKSRLGIK